MRKAAQLSLVANVALNPIEKASANVSGPLYPVIIAVIVLFKPRSCETITESPSILKHFLTIDEERTFIIMIRQSNIASMNGTISLKAFVLSNEIMQHESRITLIRISAPEQMLRPNGRLPLKILNSSEIPVAVMRNPSKLSESTGSCIQISSIPFSGLVKIRYRYAI